MNVPQAILFISVFLLYRSLLITTWQTWNVEWCAVARSPGRSGSAWRVLLFTLYIHETHVTVIIMYVTSISFLSMIQTLLCFAFLLFFSCELWILLYTTRVVLLLLNLVLTRRLKFEVLTSWTFIDFAINQKQHARVLWSLLFYLSFSSTKIKDRESTQNRHLACTCVSPFDTPSSNRWPRNSSHDVQ